MFRARLGDNAKSGNKVLLAKQDEKMKKEHRERLQKIKTRKPGSSTTLDNMAPVVIEAMKTNPRKVKLKEVFNRMTEQENK